MLKSGPVSNAKKRHGPPGLFLSTAVRAVIREPGRNKPQSIEVPAPGYCTVNVSVVVWTVVPAVPVTVMV
jgi:hypothetical protein